jgi:predicted nucleic acid-binding protein
MPIPDAVLELFRILLGSIHVRHIGSSSAAWFGAADGERSNSIELTNLFNVVQLFLQYIMESDMDIVIDTSALIAVIVEEPERTKIIELTIGNTLIGPGSIPWEIGNAFSAMFKQDRLTIDEARKGLSIFESIPIRYVEPDFTNALRLSKETNMYAYDAYLLDCAIRYKSPLLTLDRKLIAAAKNFKVDALEV